MAASGNRWVSPGTCDSTGRPCCGDDAPADRAGTGDADLLADDGPDGGLVTVDLARDPQAGGRPDEVAEDRVGAEVLVDRAGVAVGVEQSAYALGRGGGVAQVVQPELGRDEARAGVGPEVVEVESHGAGTVRQVEGAGVPPRSGDLDARHEVEGEEVEEPTPGEGGADGEPHGDRPPSASARCPALPRPRSSLGEAA